MRLPSRAPASVIFLGNYDVPTSISGRFNDTPNRPVLDTAPGKDGAVNGRWTDPHCLVRSPWEAARTLVPGFQRLTGAQILATGSYVPENVVSNDDLRGLGCDAEWIVQRTGIQERRHAGKDQTTVDLAEQAARRLFDISPAPAAEIDMLLLATISPDRPMPSSACELQSRLGLACPAMDVVAACSGFIYALVTGMSFVRAGLARHVLVVASDTLSRWCDPRDPKIYPLFGDGAGAALIGPGNDEQGFLSVALGAEGEGAELLHVPGGGSREPLTADGLAAGRQYMQMEGRQVFKWAVRRVAESCRRALEAADLTSQDIRWVALHQANARILDAALIDLGLDRDRSLTNLARYGNTSGASMSLILDDAWRAGQLSPGDRLLFSGFGAGLSWGTGVFVV